MLYFGGIQKKTNSVFGGIQKNKLCFGRFRKEKAIFLAQSK
jgi:hypothetical protein